MRLGEVIERMDSDDETIRWAVDHADVFPLLAAVAQCTGDLSILLPACRPDPTRLLEPAAGVDEAVLDQARALAADALAKFRDNGSIAAPVPSEAVLRELFTWLIGAGTDRYFEVLREELAPGGLDARAPKWRKDEVAREARFSVAIIGAGMSGIAAAHRLAQAGIPFAVFEKNADVGGTWLENAYPGCRVDVANHLYSYSFAQSSEWPEFYSSQDVLLDYFKSCANEFGISGRIFFNAEVLGADWNDEAQEWTLRVSSDGRTDEHRFSSVISAVGQLNRPKMPEIDGQDRFFGTAFHSARWDHSIDLSDKRVAVIGTGASAVQFIPPVAEQAKRTMVFQRTPPWLVPTPSYTDRISEGLEFVLRHVPGYARWDRLWLFWRTHEGLFETARVDPEWPEPERSISAANDRVREVLTAHLRAEFPDDDLFEKVLPRYPPIAERVIRDNGIWARTLTRDDVELISDDIIEITMGGVRTRDGVEHGADVLIYGTGFEASDFLAPMQVRGRGGVELHDRWRGDARAYLGMTVPEFPNFFICYGPNTNLVINGSIVFFSECEIGYVLEAIRELFAGGHRSLECRPEVHDAYNEQVDRDNAAMAWGASSVNSWYKNASGRVSQNWPYSLIEYWEKTRAVRHEDYIWR